MASKSQDLINKLGGFLAAEIKNMYVADRSKVDDLLYRIDQSFEGIEHDPNLVPPSSLARAKQGRMLVKELKDFIITGIKQ